MESRVLVVATLKSLIGSGQARRIREEAGVRRSDLAYDLNVHESTIVRWESGDRFPRSEVACHYLDKLHEIQKVGA
jgi:DNA-binding transcriptional regulator YiaG